MLQLSVLLLWIVLLILACVLAWITHDKAFKYAAAICAIGYLLTIPAENWRPDWASPQIKVFIIDAAAAIALALVMVRRPEPWAIAATAFQSAAAGLHIAYFAASHYVSSGYILGLIILSFLLIGSIISGEVVFIRRDKAGSCFRLPALSPKRPDQRGDG